MGKITPCLWFDGQGEEAANFYTRVFKNSRILNIARYGEAGPGAAGAVMTVTFELDGQRFVALNGGPQFTFTEAISLQVVYAKPRLRLISGRCFRKLATRGIRY